MVNANSLETVTEIIDFAGLTFRGLRKTELLQPSYDLKLVITVNAEFIVLANKNPRFKKLIMDNYATFDGQVPFLLAKFRNRNSDFEKISGSDFIKDVCIYSKCNAKKVFLLGGYEESNKAAVSVLRDTYKIEIEGYSPPWEPYPFSNQLNDFILEKISMFKPDCLMVAFGAPKQEFWIDDNKEHLRALGTGLAVGVGGTFELIAGKEKRAPEIIQKVGLESIWRLCQNPSRFKRFVNNFKMFKYI